MNRRMVVLLILAFALLATSAFGQEKKFEFYPGAQYDPKIPTLEQVVGHAWGENITSHAEVEKYLEALVKATPRARLVRYGATWEGRALYYLIVASDANIARLEQVKAGMKRLADPRGLSDADAEQLVKSLPVVVWLSYGVHGNEISSTDASLLAAYHLLAAQNDDVVEQILEHDVVIFDPMQNPDGRDRFIHYFRQTRGPEPDADMLAAEHNENWPSGRVNHYLFDMNRDWFALTQLETRGRVKAILDWFPILYVDLHEMGSNSTYYFTPPALPHNPNFTKAQVEWLYKVGQNNSEWFDRFRFDYFTRDVFDSFYPGYGESWPMFHGAIGSTYEQASTRGLVVKRDDDTTMHYRDTVHHHFISSISTAQMAARNREALLRYFLNYRRTAVTEGQQETVKEFILAPGSDPNRASKLAALLMQMGVEVKRADKPFTNAKVRDYYEEKLQSKEFPAGTYIISLAQPAKRLAKTLLDKHTPQNREFIEEQIRRAKKRIGDQFYDVTGWSLPLAYDVEAYSAEAASTGSFTTLQSPPAAHGRLIGGKAHLAYLIPWGTNSAARATFALLRQGVRLHRNDLPFTLNNVKFAAGAVIIKVKDNPADLHERITKLVVDFGVEVHSTDRAWIEEGANLGSNYVHYVTPPRVALAWNEPVSPLSAGWARYVLEQMYGVPVTLVRTQQMRGADLSRFNVIILPGAFGGGYADRLGEPGAQNLKTWVQQGGTLITFGDATRWLTEERVGLLAATREMRSGAPERPAGGPPPAAGQQAPAAAAAKPGEEKRPEPAKPEFDLEKAIQPDREPPAATPGAIFRARVDNEHWLGFGYGGSANVMVDSSSIYTPLKLDRGTNVVTYTADEKNLLSGFTWDASRRQIGNKAYLMHQRAGRGNVVAFAEDPNYRAFMDGLNLLFLNGIVCGPSH